MASDNEEWTEVKDEWEEIPVDTESKSVSAPGGSPFEIKQPFSSMNNDDLYKALKGTEETVKDTYSAFEDAIPLKGFAEKASQKLVSMLPGAESYDSMRKKSITEDLERNRRTPTGTLLGSIAGSAIVPIKAPAPTGPLSSRLGSSLLKPKAESLVDAGKNAASRIAFNAADGASMAEDPYEAAINAAKAGGTTALLESLPIGGRVMKAGGKALQKGSNALMNAGAFGIGAYESNGDLSDKVVNGLKYAGGTALGGAMANNFAKGKVDSFAKVMDKLGSLPIKYQKLLTGPPQQAALTHYLLEKDDPEYRALVNGE